MTLKNYLLIFGLIVLTAFTSCKKDKEEDTPPAAGLDVPEISVNATATGNIINVPQNAMYANDGQFSNVVGSVNQIGNFLTALNSVPDNATVTSRSTNSTTMYNWTVTQGDVIVEYWYTIIENGSNYDLTYEFAYTSPDLTIARNIYISGSVAQDGKNGHLVFNYDAFTDGETTFNYTYDWDTNTAGDLHILAYWNIDDMDYTNMIYEATVYAVGGGVAEYRYSNLDNDSIVWHYEWNADWSIITWTYTVNGEEDENMSGEWTA